MSWLLWVHMAIGLVLVVGRWRVQGPVAKHRWDSSQRKSAKHDGEKEGYSPESGDKWQWSQVRPWGEVEVGFEPEKISETQ